MFKIAVIQFPGLNTEYETRREINRAGMRGEFFRWNDDPKKLEKYDGYVIGGGFSYEDRGRAGIIASLDPLMQAIKDQAAKGKPVLGICNGAQILVESGLVPGAEGDKLALSLARNKRIKDGVVLGTGYYNAWVHIKCMVPKESCMFTWNMHAGEILEAPIAHGEGRFTTEIAELMPQLLERGQLPFRYCDKQGVMLDEFPVNPNGAMFSAAAICNPEGNVMAIMPHLERDLKASNMLFTSMRDALKANKSSKRVPKLSVKELPTYPLPSYSTPSLTFSINISLIITDNEADTFESTARNLGFEGITLKRTTHVEISYKGKQNIEKLARTLINSGVLLNTNKEYAMVDTGKQRLMFDSKRDRFNPAEKESVAETTFSILVREKQDFEGLSKTSTLQKRLKLNEITDVKVGTEWKITFPTKSKTVAEAQLKKLLATHLFFNPHRQEAFQVG